MHSTAVMAQFLLFRGRWRGCEDIRPVVVMLSIFSISISPVTFWIYSPLFYSIVYLIVIYLLEYWTTNRIAVVVDSHIERIVPATEEVTVTQQVSVGPIKCQSRSWSQRGAKVNGSHHGDNPLLRPTGIQIATKSLPGPTNREHRKLIGMKTTSPGMNYSLYPGMLPVFQNLNYKLRGRLSDVLPSQESHQKCSKKFSSYY